MRKRLLMMLAVAVLLVGCGNTNNKDTEANTQQTETERRTDTEIPTEIESETTTEVESESTTEVVNTEVESETPTQTETESEVPQPPTYTYTDLNKTMYAKSSVNVRSLPSTDGEKLGGLSKGQEVSVTGQCNETGWYRINYNGGTGYVSSSYLVDEKPVEETPTQPSEPSEPEECPVTMYQLFDEGDRIYCWVFFHASPRREGYGAENRAILDQGHALAVSKWELKYNHHICREHIRWGNYDICLVEWIPY